MPGAGIEPANTHRLLSGFLYGCSPPLRPDLRLCLGKKLSGKRHRLLTIIWYHVSCLPTQAISSLAAQCVKNKCVFVLRLTSLVLIRLVSHHEDRICLNPHLCEIPKCFKQIDLLVSLLRPPTRRGLSVFPDCHLRLLWKGLFILIQPGYKYL